MKQSYVELNYLIWSSQACDKYLTLAFSLQLFPRRTSWELSISLSSTTHTWTQVRQVKQPRVRPAWPPWPRAAHELRRKIWYEHSHGVGRSVLERKRVKSVASHIFPRESLQLLIHLGLGGELRISGIQLASQPNRVAATAVQKGTFSNCDSWASTNHSEHAIFLPASLFSSFWWERSTTLTGNLGAEGNPAWVL